MRLSDEDRERIAGKAVVVGISGGKDSAALACWLEDEGVDFECVFADTEWEAPQTYEYLEELKRRWKVTVVRSKLGGMVEWVRQKGMFPSRPRRFCTQELKWRPIKEYLDSFDVEVVNAVGIRAEESQRRAAMPVWEHDHLLGHYVWRPLLHWTHADIVEIHREHDLLPNPLYLAGSTRVGCWPCIFAGKVDIKVFADLTPEKVDLIRDLEEEITIAADARAAAKGESNVHPRTWFSGRGPRKLGGRSGVMPIDEAVRWSRTAGGGRQLQLLEPPPEGCARWGLCGVEGDGWPT